MSIVSSVRKMALAAAIATTATAGLGASSGTVWADPWHGGHRGDWHPGWHGGDWHRHHGWGHGGWAGPRLGFSPPVYLAPRPYYVPRCHWATRWEPGPYGWRRVSHRVCRSYY